jgi:hypothetical protein
MASPIRQHQSERVKYARRDDAKGIHRLWVDWVQQRTFVIRITNLRIPYIAGNVLDQLTINFSERTLISFTLCWRLCVLCVAYCVHSTYEYNTWHKAIKYANRFACLVMLYKGHINDNFMSKHSSVCFIIIYLLQVI